MTPSLRVMTSEGELVMRPRTLRDRVLARRDVEALKAAEPGVVEGIGDEGEAEALAVMARQVVSLGERTDLTLSDLVGLPERWVHELVTLSVEVEAAAASFRVRGGVPS